jgi:two-component sensor histidine kinase
VVKNPGWRLSVSDSGSGLKESDGEPPHTGLGTSIVEALAHQLKARVEKTSGPQGTVVAITASALGDSPHDVSTGGDS